MSLKDVNFSSNQSRAVIQCLILIVVTIAGYNFSQLTSTLAKVAAAQQAQAVTLSAHGVEIARIGEQVTENSRANRQLLVRLSGIGGRIGEIEDAILTIAVDDALARRMLRRLPGECREGAAQALTWLAQGAKADVAPDAVRMGLSLRRPWFAQGFRYQAATPQGLRARVYHKDRTLSKHERPGRYRAMDRGRLSVPVALQRDSRGRLPRGQKARQLLAQGKAFDDPRAAGALGGRGKKRRGKRGAYGPGFLIESGSKTFIVQRRYGHGGGRPETLRAAYQLSADGDYRRRLDVQGAIRRMVEQEAAATFRRAMRARLRRYARGR